MTNTYHSDIVNNDIAKTTLSNNNETNWTWSNTAQYVTQIGRINQHILYILNIGIHCTIEGVAKQGVIAAYLFVPKINI